jgi:lipopolysaccharide export system permease protein
MKITRYILRAHIGPFLFSLVTLLFIFLLQFLMKYIDTIAGKGLSWYVIVEFIGLSLAWIVVLAVPMSVLVSTLMAFGMLSSTNEITILKSAGVSIYRIIFPVFISAGFLTYFLIWFNNEVLPDANHRWATLFRDIQRKKPTLTLEPGVFNKDMEGYCFLVRKTYENSNELDNVTIYDYTNYLKNIVVTAKRGEIAFTPNSNNLIMNLTEGEIHETSVNNSKEYRRIFFKKHRIIIGSEQFDFKRSSQGTFSRSDRELSAKSMNILVDSLTKNNNTVKNTVSEMMLQNVNNLLIGKSIDSVITGYRPEHFIALKDTDLAMYQAKSFFNQLNTHLTRIESNNHSIDSYLVEIYKKYSIPAACLIFVLLGAPLGIMARKGGFGIGASLSLGFFLLYWACLIGGEKLADRDIASPFLGMWIANIILGILGIYLVYKVAKESAVINWDFLRKLVPKQFRTLEDENNNT